MVLLAIDDAEAAAALHAACLPEAYSVASFRSLLAEPGVSGWKLEGLAALDGLIVWRQMGSEAELLSLAVAPLVRRQGVASWLLGRLLAMLEAGGVERCFLEVRAGNRAAQSLYAKVGFHVISRRAGYYRTGAEAEDAVVMEWRRAG